MCMKKPLQSGFSTRDYDKSLTDKTLTVVFSGFGSGWLCSDNYAAQRARPFVEKPNTFIVAGIGFGYSRD